MLTQETEGGERKVIATAGRALTGPECRMFVTEIEVAAIYFALQKFRDFIYDHKVIIKSDNISLAFLQKCRLTSSRISRYIHESMSHHVDIQHVRGVDNVFADTLSRLPRAADAVNNLESRGNGEVIIMRLNVRDKLNLSRKFQDLLSQQQSVPELRTIAQAAPEIGTLEANCGRFGVKGGYCTKKRESSKCLGRHMFLTIWPRNSSQRTMSTSDIAGVTASP